MNDEIKELLEHIEILDNTDYILHSDKAKALLDYITNLQKENEEFRLLKERYQLIKEIYKERIDKAIEYIEDNTYEAYETEYMDLTGIKELKNILGGDEE